MQNCSPVTLANDTGVLAGVRASEELSLLNAELHSCPTTPTGQFVKDVRSRVICNSSIRSHPVDKMIAFAPFTSAGQLIACGFHSSAAPRL